MSSIRRNKRTVAVVAGVGLVALGLLTWTVWPTVATPLARLLRQDATWQDIQSRKTWRVGLDPSFPPFETLDGTGAPIGFDVDLAHKIGGQLGVNTEIVAIGFDSLVDAVKAAKVDAVISAYPYDPRLTRDVGYSRPYFDAGLRLAVAKDSGLQKVEDLTGKRVAVEWGSEGDMVGRQLQRQGVALTLVARETPQAAIDAVIQEKAADAVLIDNVTLVQAQERGAPLMTVGAPLSSSAYVVVVPQQAFELRDRVDAALAQLQAGGALNELEAKWFAQEFAQQ